MDKIAMRVAGRFVREMVAEQPDKVKRLYDESTRQLMSIMKQVKPKLEKTFPGKKWQNPRTRDIYQGSVFIDCYAGDWKVVEGVQLIAYVSYDGFRPDKYEPYVLYSLRLRYPGSNSDEIANYRKKMPTASQVFRDVVAHSDKMYKREPGDFDKKGIREFVEGLRTWFEFDDESQTSISFATRDNGDVGNERPGRPDLDEAKRIIKELKDKYPALGVNGDTADEWVYVKVYQK